MARTGIGVLPPPVPVMLLAASVASAIVEPMLALSVAITAAPCPALTSGVAACVV